MSRTARLGAFIFAAFILLSSGVFLIGKRQLLFGEKRQLRAGFDTVSGLSEGAEVRMGGIRVGTVASVRLPEKPEDKITVLMDMDANAQRLIRKDSLASIQTEGLLGNKYVKVTVGSAHAAPVGEGEAIGTAETPDISDILQKTNQILDTTDATMKNIQAATLNVKEITEKVNSGQGTLGRLVNNNDIYRELHATSERIAETAEQARAGATGFRENMEALKQNWLFRGFFKKRGYVSEADLTRYHIENIPSSPSKTFVLDAEDLFDSNEAKLEGKKKLADIGKYLESRPFRLAVVTASLGVKGKRQENLTLSQARALVVRDYLVENFKTPEDQIKTKGLGERPPAGGGPAERIEVLVFGAR